MKRCAIYARYSTDKQDVQSIETQLMMCRREVMREGWQEVGTPNNPGVIRPEMIHYPHGRR